MTDEIREKVWNIMLVVQEIKDFPQTYNTILGKDRKDGTLQTILRRKLNKLCKEGTICRTTIPGTRFGKTVFYCLPKKYHILIEATRIGSSVYCFFDFEKLGRYYVKISPYWKLEKGNWNKKDEKIIFEGNVLKWI